MPFRTLNKDMQLTKAEFAKRIPGALDGYEWAPSPTGYRAHKDAQIIEIEIQELEPRRIALIVLPRCAVSFRFEGFTSDERAAFLSRFDRIYQKGGG